MWEIEYIPEARKELLELDGSVRKKVEKSIIKVSSNPLPKSEGGYGNPLGNKQGRNLTGLLKIKLLKEGIRVVYKLVHENNRMKIIVIGARADSEVYEQAAERIYKNKI